MLYCGHCSRTHKTQIPVTCKRALCYAHIAAVQAAIKDAQFFTLAAPPKQADTENGLGQVSVKTNRTTCPRPVFLTLCETAAR